MGVSFDNSTDFATRTNVVQDMNAMECGLPPTTESTIAITWLKRCIISCQNGHSDCRESFIPITQERFLPTRLLDIGNENNSMVRLVLTSELPTTTSLGYIALSHSWGGAIDFLLLGEFCSNAADNSGC
jgi:hypothetical protein